MQGLLNSALLARCPLAAAPGVASAAAGPASPAADSKSPTAGVATATRAAAATPAAAGPNTAAPFLKVNFNQRLLLLLAEAHYWSLSSLEGKFLVPFFAAELAAQQGEQLRVLRQYALLVSLSKHQHN
jgi:hypothetical protein